MSVPIYHPNPLTGWPLKCPDPANCAVWDDGVGRGAVDGARIVSNVVVHADTKDETKRLFGDYHLARYGVAGAVDGRMNPVGITSTLGDAYPPEILAVVESFLSGYPERVVGIVPSGSFHYSTMLSEVAKDYDFVVFLDAPGTSSYKHALVGQADLFLVPLHLVVHYAGRSPQVGEAFLSWGSGGALWESEGALGVSGVVARESVGGSGGSSASGDSVSTVGGSGGSGTVACGTSSGLEITGPLHPSNLELLGEVAVVYSDRIAHNVHGYEHRAEDTVTDPALYKRARKHCFRWAVYLSREAGGLPGEPGFSSRLSGEERELWLARLGDPEQ